LPVARIEWVDQRLKNWALWIERQAGGGLGFYSQSSFLNEVDSSRYREARIPVDEVDAGVTNEAVKSLLPERKHLHDTLQGIYVQGLGVRETARRECCAESTIKARLEQADHVLAVWFTERKRAQEARRAAIEATIRKSSTS
jgi:hypothetical protein